MITDAEKAKVDAFMLQAQQRITELEAETRRWSDAEKQYKQIAERREQDLVNIIAQKEAKLAVVQAFADQLQGQIAKAKEALQ